MRRIEFTEPDSLSGQFIRPITQIHLEEEGRRESSSSLHTAREAWSREETEVEARSAVQEERKPSLGRLFLWIAVAAGCLAGVVGWMR